MRIQALLPLAFVLVLGCPKKDERPDATPEPRPNADRVPAVSKDHRLYARVEGISFRNDCADDTQCRTGGCSSEVCSAEEGVNTTCEIPEGGFPQGAAAACGCVARECIWFVKPGAAGESPTTQPQ